MDQTQCAQRLDQVQLGPVKVAHLLVPIEQSRQLLRALSPVPRQQHPQVLHGRAHAGVVQVHKVRATAGQLGRCPQDIARVAVAMQADQAAF